MELAGLKVPLGLVPEEKVRLGDHGPSRIGIVGVGGGRCEEVYVCWGDWMVVDLLSPHA